jgi:hypothetical protein
MKVVWVGPISLSATLKSLLFNTFIKILKLAFKRQIGLYYYIMTASVTFGNKGSTQNLDYE